MDEVEAEPFDDFFLVAGLEVFEAVSEGVEAIGDVFEKL